MKLFIETSSYAAREGGVKKIGICLAAVLAR
jgi:hypothetical protein